MSRLSFRRAFLLFACCIATLCSCARISTESVGIADSPSNNASGEDAGRININTAPSSDLEKLPGVGSVLADRIVAYREQYGSFQRPEHLMMVRGISERKFRELRPFVKVE